MKGNLGANAILGSKLEIAKHDICIVNRSLPYPCSGDILFFLL